MTARGGLLCSGIAVRYFALLGDAPAVSFFVSAIASHAVSSPTGQSPHPALVELLADAQSAFERAQASPPD